MAGPLPDGAQGRGAVVRRLCVETQSREIVARLINDEIERALRLGIDGDATAADVGSGIASPRRGRSGE